MKKTRIPSREEACSRLPEWMKKDEGCHYKDGWLHAGNVAVDSGTIGIIDPLMDIQSDEKLLKFFEKNDFGNTVDGFFASGFGGDGIYPVYLKLSSKGAGIDAAMIDFSTRSGMKLFCPLGECEDMPPASQRYKKGTTD
jgi:hypothetical protein